ncbi:MAG TPA: Pnap_2097 family protein [Afipia sp.]
MNLYIAAPPIEIESDGALSPSVKIGMPHLSLTGLSENWLLKECGHRHWFLLAEAAGTSVPDFRDAVGDQAYAVFRAVAIRDAKFNEVIENDDLHFTSKLSRISRTQFVSLHYLFCRGRKIGEIEMISSFVKRTIAGVNRSVARVELNAFPFVGEVASSALAEVAGGFWNGSWIEHRGFGRSQSGDKSQLVVRPNPSLDFNGAGFLYFSSFQSLIDRAEWETLDTSSSLTTASREIFYYGNIEPGERVVIRIEALDRQGEGYSHWCTLRRECDDAKLADVFTAREPV